MNTQWMFLMYAANLLMKVSFSLIVVYYFFAKKLALSSYTHHIQVTHCTVWRKGMDTSQKPATSTVRVREEVFCHEDWDSKVLRNMDTFLTRHIAQDNNFDMTFKTHKNPHVF